MFKRSPTYLDFAAANPVLPDARRAFMKTLRAFGNPSSPHTEGRGARESLEEARATIAALASVKADAVIFTSGATEANALAIVGLVQGLAAQSVLPGDMHILYLPSAHASTIGAIERVRSLGVECEALTLTNAGIDLTRLRDSLTQKTRLVALEAVCGETGTRFDVRGARLVLDRYSKEQGGRIYLHADASQLPAVESFARTRLACDTLALDAQKVGGVRGIGALIAPRAVPLAPLMLGGGQERGLRPGTESNAAASAFARALESNETTRLAFAKRAESMRNDLLTRITAALPDVRENAGHQRVPHILNISLLGRDTDYLVALLDEAGFMVSARSACESNEEGSRAVLALTEDAARASSALRISWGPSTRPHDLSRFSEALIRAVRFLDQGTV